jgi:4'-phosphopantetheinyl transferase
LLSSDELERMAKFRFEEHRRDFLFARSRLRVVLGAYLDAAPERLRFSYSEHGKPGLASPFSQTNLQFNLSHTSGALLLAVCRGQPIGADIERVREDLDLGEIAARFFSEGERRSLMALSENVRQEAFFRCWTRKEALLKARGDGLSFPLHLFDVSLAADENQVALVTRQDPQEAERWQIVPLTVPAGYAAAVALASSRSAAK